MHKLLIISTRLPYPLMGGDRIRIYNVCKLLARGYVVDLLVIHEGNVNQNDVDEISKLGVNVILFEYSSLRFKLNTLLGVISKLPLQVKYYFFGKVQRWIDEHIGEYDLVFCNHIRSGEYVKDKNIPKIIDLHDAISMNYSRARDYTSGVWKWIYNVENDRVLRHEIDMIRSFDTSLIVSAIDKEFLIRNGADPARIKVIPVAVDERFQINNHNQEQEWISFVGKMNTVANADAAAYFANRVFPEIRKQAPNTEFYIVGADPNAEVKKLSAIDNVRVTGKVVDHREYILKSKVVVAPMRFGAGMQNKILEAMALGKPVVTTTIGAEGIEGVDGVHFLIGDSAMECSEQVLRLLNDLELRRAICIAGQKLVQEKYTWDIVGKSLLNEIQQLIGDND